MTSDRARAVCAVSFALCSAALPSIAADTDACTLLTPAQVGAAIGGAVGAGSHVTPTFVKTCTWTPTGKSNVKAVTLNMQTAATYDSGKQHVAMASAATQGSSMQPASVGDDAYYFVTGDQAWIVVKKGAAAFKVTVYATIPVADKEAMELKLAKEVLGKL